MRFSYRMPRDEMLFGLVVASVHGSQHVFLRLFPPLIPILVVDLEASLWQLGLLVSVYLFAGGLFQAPMGVLSDRVDRRYLLIPAFLAMSLGYLIFVLASTVGTLLPAVAIFGHVFDGPYQVMALGMFVAGFGYSAIHPVGYPLISANVSVENKGKVLGMWGSASKLGDAVAPLLVGVSAFGIVYAVLLFVIFRHERFETRPASRTADRDRGDTVDWRANPKQFLLPIAVVVLSFFFILFAGNGLQTYTPVFVADVYGYSLSIAGIEIQPASVANFYFAVLLISGALSQLAMGVLTDVFDYRAVLMGLLGVSTVGLFVLSSVSLTPLVLLLAFVVLGSCIFGLNPARDALISDITPAELEGRTFGYIWTIALVGSSAYPAIIGYLADSMGIQASFAFLAVGTLGGLACIGLLYSPYVYQERPTPTIGGD